MFILDLLIKPQLSVERLMSFLFSILQEDLRPYFSLPKVMDGLFNLAKFLFGVDIEPADGLATVKYISTISFLLLCCRNIEFQFTINILTL